MLSIIKEQGGSLDLEFEGFILEVDGMRVSWAVSMDIPREGNECPCIGVPPSFTYTQPRNPNTPFYLYRIKINNHF